MESATSTGALCPFITKNSENGKKPELARKNRTTKAGMSREISNIHVALPPTIAKDRETRKVAAAFVEKKGRNGAKQINYTIFRSRAG